MMKRTLIIAGCAASWLSAACAQPTPAVPSTPPLPVQPPSATIAPPEQIAPRDGATDNGTTMSDRLSRQQGAVKPPSVDPGMSVQPKTGAGTMPVIPPPGSPGGNPSVVPK